jgi:prepilin-type N-terminal cleavage/methylation domain-containing protein
VRLASGATALCGLAGLSRWTQSGDHLNARAADDIVIAGRQLPFFYGRRMIRYTSCRHHDRATCAGFTLVELLVVVLVIGTLAALLLPALSSAKRKAWRIQCLSNIKQLTTANLLYVTDNARHSAYNSPAYPGGHWMGALSDQYGKQTNLLICPSAPLRDPPPASASYSQGSADRAWVRWTHDKQHMFFGSYGYNGWLYSDALYSDKKFPSAGDPRHKLIFAREASIQRPSLTPVFVDANWLDMWPLEIDTPWPDLYNGAPMGRLQDNMSRCTIPRHGWRNPSSAPRNFPAGRPLPGAINMGLADGHGELVRLQSLWNFYWHLDWQPAPASPQGP